MVFKDARRTRHMWRQIVPISQRKSWLISCGWPSCRHCKTWHWITSNFTRHRQYVRCCRWDLQSAEQHIDKVSTCCILRSFLFEKQLTYVFKNVFICIFVQDENIFARSIIPYKTYPMAVFSYTYLDRGYLVKQICRCHGMETYQTLCKSDNARLSWVSLEEQVCFFKLFQYWFLTVKRFNN